MKALNLFVVFGLLIAGCSRGDTSVYTEYVSNLENGLFVSKSHKGLNVTAQYLPVEYQVLNQINRGLKANKVSGLIDDMRGHHYFKVSLSSPLTIRRIIEKNGKSFNDVYLQLQYHSQSRFKIKNGSTDYPCVLYHAQSGINPSNKMELMLVFRNDSFGAINNDLILQFEDDLITNTNYELIIKKEAINSIPEVELL